MNNFPEWQQRQQSWEDIHAKSYIYLNVSQFELMRDLYSFVSPHPWHVRTVSRTNSLLKSHKIFTKINNKNLQLVLTRGGSTLKAKVHLKCRSLHAHATVIGNLTMEDLWGRERGEWNSLRLMEKLKIKINCERGPLLATEQLFIFSLSNEFAHWIQIPLNRYSITDAFAHSIARSDKGKFSWKIKKLRSI